MNINQKIGVLMICIISLFAIYAYDISPNNNVLPIESPEEQQKISNINLSLNLNKMDVYKDELEKVLYFYDKNFNDKMRVPTYLLLENQTAFFAPYIKFSYNNKVDIKLLCPIYVVDDDILPAFTSIIWNIDEEIFTFNLKDIYPVELFKYGDKNCKYFESSFDFLNKISGGKNVSYRLKGYSNLEKNITKEEISIIRNILQCEKDIITSLKN